MSPAPARTANTATGRVAGGGNPAGDQAGTGAVQPVLDGAVRHLALGQRYRLMRAFVAQGIDARGGPDQADRVPADAGAGRAALLDPGQAAGPHPAAGRRRAHRQASAAREPPEPRKRRQERYVTGMPRFPSRRPHRRTRQPAVFVYTSHSYKK